MSKYRRHNSREMMRIWMGMEMVQYSIANKVSFAALSAMGTPSITIVKEE
jgi:hypothetical protein